MRFRKLYHSTFKIETQRQKVKRMETLWRVSAMAGEINKRIKEDRSSENEERKGKKVSKYKEFEIRGKEKEYRKRGRKEKDPFKGSEVSERALGNDQPYFLHYIKINSISYICIHMWLHMCAFIFIWIYT